MVTRACISINNRCNLNCTYCHFHEKIHIGSVVMARQRSSMEIFILAINHFFLKRNYKPRLLTNLKLQR